MTKKAVTPTVTQEEVRLFVLQSLTYINRSAGEIEWVDKNGNNMTTGFSFSVYEAINKAILVERGIEKIVY